MTLPCPATTAASEFRRRRVAWAQSPGGITDQRAQTNLYLWLAIACAAGCVDRALGDAYVDELEWFRGTPIWPNGAGLPPVWPHHIARRVDWQDELMRARDTLLSRALHPDAAPELQARAAAVAELARALRCPLHRDQAASAPVSDERKAA